MEFKEWLSLFISIGTLLGMLLMAYNGWKKPTEDNTDSLREMKLECGYKHKSLDEVIGRLDKTLFLIQENDLKHIELRLNDHSDKLTKLYTILDERLPKK
ncbi:MAG: hypothetical protein WC241_05355 [Candidatus Paceibacterota bacterium]|jgi:hypothetical protein